MSSGPYRGKRLVDLTVLAVVAIPATLIGLLAALAVAVSSRGPVLFHQDRVGIQGRTFDCLKFRTMLHGENPLIPDDSRITSVGRVLRRFSLDELPQLINAARGDMSVVGPRPMLGFQYDRCDDRQKGRTVVRPGLTGWAQINGRNALSWTDRIELDLEYVERQSARFDLKVLVGTPMTLLSPSGLVGHSADDPFVTDPDRDPDFSDA